MTGRSLSHFNKCNKFNLTRISGQENWVSSAGLERVGSCFGGILKEFFVDIL